MDQITKHDFHAYERVRAGGRFNMMTDSRRAMSEASLDRDVYVAIISNYEALLEKYGRPNATH